MTKRLVKDINTNGNSSPNELIDIEGTLYFTADSGGSDTGSIDNSEETDGDGSANGPTSSGASGMGLWKSDGSEGGTRLIASFDGISNLVDANGTLYFIGEIEEKFEIWSSDGTASGTKRIDSIYPGSDGFAAYNLFAVDDTLFFSSSGPEASSNDYELWRWEGKDAGTKLFKNLFPDRYITNQSIDDDGTLTIETAAFNANTPEFSSDSFPSNFTNAGNGNFFFTAYSTQIVEAFVDGFADEIQLGGIELWFSNGTENGTYSIPINNESYEIYNPVDGSASPPSLYDEYYQATGSSFPKHLTAFNNRVYFSASNGIQGFELWSINNQGVGENIVQDINSNGSSTPEDLTVVGNRLYFTADDGDGRTLWYVDTENKAKKVANSGKDPRNLTDIDGDLFYSANSEAGREPWFIENNKMAIQLQDINPGLRSSNPSNFQLIKREIKGKTQDFLYFSANDGQRGSELWNINLSRKDKRAQRLEDLYSGPAGSDPRQLTNSNQELFFTANDGKSGRELWTIGIEIESPSGGEDNWQSIVKVSEKQTFVYTFSTDKGSAAINLWSIKGGADSAFFSIDESTGALSFKTAPNYAQPKDLTGDNNYDVIIGVTDENTGLNAEQTVTVVVTESNGLASESTLVRNIRPRDASSDPDELHNHRGALFFSANDGRKGQEPWVSSGTANSTELFLDINNGKQSSTPSSFTSYKTSVFFAADDGRHGSELWMSNGTKRGTALAADIQSGTGSSSPSDLLIQGKTLYMAADDGLHGRELWVHNIKNGQSSLIKDIRLGSKVGSNPSELTPLNGGIVFAADGNAYGRELWSSDGTTHGTKMLQDINPGGLDSNPKDFSPLDGDIYFTGDTYLNGRQIHKLDGSELTITPVQGSLGTIKLSDPNHLHASKDQLFFNAETNLDDSTDDITPNPSIGGSTSSDPGGFMTAARGIEAQAAEYINNYNDNIDSYRRFDSKDFLDNAKYWAEQLATSILVNNNDSSLASDWNKYFQSLSNSSPIQIPNDLPSTAASRSTTSSPGGSSLTPAKEEESNSLGRELWISNGKENGNKLLKDIYPGTGSSDPKGFTTSGIHTFFSADDGEHGEELWVSDGTEAGTIRLTDINDGAKDSSPRSITDVNGVIYFSAKSEDFGRELWRLGEGETSTQKMGVLSQPSNPAPIIDLTRLVYSAKGKRRLRGKQDTTDEFIFNRSNQFGHTKADLITQFSVADGDSIQLDTNAFPGLTQRRFKAVSTLQAFNRQLEQNSSVIYFEPFGELYFDQNGRQPGLGDTKNSGLFAILDEAPELTQASLGVI